MTVDPEASAKPSNMKKVTRNNHVMTGEGVDIRGDSGIVMRGTGRAFLESKYIWKGRSFSITVSTNVTNFNKILNLREFDGNIVTSFEANYHGGCPRRLKKSISRVQLPYGAHCNTSSRRPSGALAGGESAIGSTCGTVRLRRKL